MRKSNQASIDTEQAVERRSGRDRRQRDKGPPTGRRERRVTIEPRRPEVREVQPTASEWDALHDLFNRKPT